jgi:hypothetical protein
MSNPHDVLELLALAGLLRNTRAAVDAQRATVDAQVATAQMLYDAMTPEQKERVLAAAMERQRLAEEQQRLAEEQQRLAEEQQRLAAEQQRVFNRRALIYFWPAVIVAGSVIFLVAQLSHG